MSANLQLRIQMLKKVREDTNKVQVKEVAEMFAETSKLYIMQTKSGRIVKQKLTDAEFTAFLHGLCNSFLSNLYVNAAKNQKEFNERLKYVTNVNSDLTTYSLEVNKDDIKVNPPKK